MKADIVFPNGDEQSYIERALLLGFEGLVFVYSKQPRNGSFQSMKIVTAGLIDKAHYSGRKPKLSVAEFADRHVFEKIRPTIVFNQEISTKRDKTHFRNSGLDDVVCRMAKRNRTAVGFSVSSMLTTRLPRHVFLGRVMQNIRFCRRFGVKCFIASFATTPEQMRSPHELSSLAAVLGMSTAELKLGSRFLGTLF